MNTYYTNKVIWITGASSGIGRALALALDLPGTTLILSSRKADSLQLVADQITQAQTHILPLDLEDHGPFPQMANDLVEAFGRIDILINNGGISQRSNALETDISVDRKIMEVNYFGNIALSKAVVPHMRRQGEGHIVVMSSIAGKFGFFLRSSYSASKHALHGYYESLRLEEEANNIQISIVCPGKINTPISQNALSGDGSAHGEVDNNQRTGMSAEACADGILKGVAKGKREVLVGGKEIKAVKLKRFLPNLFHKIIRKQPKT